MNKIYWDNFCIEITRRCNMKCIHCMRGEPQNLDMNLTYIEEVFKNTAYIGVLHFSGGEPALNIPVLEGSLELAKKYNVMILNIDIITNGKEVPDSFIDIVKQWKKYCSLFNANQQEGFYLTIDPFHEEIDLKNIKKITANNLGQIRLDRYRPKKNIIIEKNNDTKSTYIVDCGRARTLEGYEKLPWNIKEDPPTVYKYNNNYYIIAKAMLSCNGFILKHTVYEWISEDKVKFCYYTDLLNAIEKIAMQPPKHLPFFNVFKDGRQEA